MSDTDFRERLRGSLREMVRGWREDEEEFGISSEFLSEKCRTCDAPHAKTHREIMRSRGLSGNHEACQKFVGEHFKIALEARAKKERRKFWKKWMYREKTQEERDARAAELLYLVRALQPDDWQAVIAEMKKPNPDAWMDMSTWEIVQDRLMHWWKSA